jgi:hypothetical protein
LSDFPKNQKVAYDGGVLFNTKLQAKPGMDHPARVPGNAPNTIQYDPRQMLGLPDSVFAHEQEHVLDNRAKGRYGSDWTKDQGMYDAFVKAGGNPDGDYQQNFRSALANPEVQKHLESIGLSDGYTSGYPVPQPTGMINGAPWNELMASMSGYEQAKNVDLTKDPVLGKALFSDPAFAAAYKASTGLRTERLDAKDLAPYTPDMSGKR